MNAKARPTGVPVDAWWEEEDCEWAFGSLDQEGRRDGFFAFWRPDGTRSAENTFVAGVVQGPFRRFHENGEVSQTGTFVDGELHGTRTWIGSEAPTSENTRAQGMSEAVWRSEMDYDHGRPIATRHFDRQGRRIRPDGSLYPERPENVPSESEQLPDGRWAVTGVDATGARDGRRRVWSETGDPLEEGTWKDDARDGLFRFYVPSGTYRDPRICQELGGFFEDRRVGPWTFMDGRGRVVRVVDFGVARSAAAITASTAFENHGRPEGEWESRASSLMEARQVGEALCGAARRAAASREAGELRDLLNSRTCLLAPEAALAAAANAIQNAGSSLATLCDALLRGASPAPVLRAIAVALDQEGGSRAGMDFVEAALLLAPERREFYFTRALINVSLGRPEEALADATALEPAEPANAAFLRGYLRALFPTFDYWPARIPPETYYDGLPEAPAQPLERIQLAVKKYALRVRLLRSSLLEATPGAPPAWIPPDVSPLLAGARADLEQYSFQVDGIDPDEHDMVEVDETLDVSRWELPALLRAARAEWNALCWLCWAAGLDKVAMPARLEPPREFGLAAGMAAQRLWRCRDRTLTGGRGAKQNQVPGFVWEGQQVDAMSVHLVKMAEHEYAEMQALFHWLSDARNRSPWQDNLRGS